jgi:hypothetical protein
MPANPSLAICPAAPSPAVEEPRARPRAGLTVRDAAARYRVSPDKIRSWIRRGELVAINTADGKCRKPRFVIPPEALERFERGRQAGAPPKPQRRTKRQAAIDYFPD